MLYCVLLFFPHSFPPDLRATRLFFSSPSPVFLPLSLSLSPRRLSYLSASLRPHRSRTIDCSCTAPSTAPHRTALHCAPAKPKLVHPEPTRGSWTALVGRFKVPTYSKRLKSETRPEAKTKAAKGKGKKERKKKSRETRFERQKKWLPLSDYWFCFLLRNTEYCYCSTTYYFYPRYGTALVLVQPSLPPPFRVSDKSLALRLPVHSLQTECILRGVFSQQHSISFALGGPVYRPGFRDRQAIAAWSSPWPRTNESEVCVCVSPHGCGRCACARAVATHAQAAAAAAFQGPSAPRLSPALPYQELPSAS